MIRRLFSLPILSVAAKNIDISTNKIRKAEICKLIRTGSIYKIIHTDTLERKKRKGRLQCCRILHQLAADFFTGFLLDIDEAQAVMDRTDVEALHSEQEAARREQGAQDNFVMQFSQLRKLAEPAAPRRRKIPLRPLPDAIAQADAKHWIPPGSSIWRGNVRQEWCGHMPPHKRIQASCTLLTEPGALRDVLRRLWRQWMHIHGKSLADVPITGLFDAVAETAVVPLA